MQAPRTRIAYIALALLAGGCSSVSVPSEFFDDKNYFSYIPIPPVPSYSYSEDGQTRKPWPHTDLTTLLPILHSTVALRKLDTAGKVSYLGSSVTASAGTYEVMMDFIKCRIEDVTTNSGEVSGYAYVGVGIRFIAHVTTYEAGIDLSTLPGLAAAASMKQLSGSISMLVIGIDHKDAVLVLPLAQDMSQSAIQSAMQGLASIKSKLNDAQTKLTPHIVGLVRTRSSEESADIIKKTGLRALAPNQ